MRWYAWYKFWECKECFEEDLESCHSCEGRNLQIINNIRKMGYKDILLLISPVVSAWLGALFTYYFAIKTRKSENIIKFKEEKYSNLIIALQGFIWNTTSYELKKNFFEEQYKSWLYASDEVTISINELINFIIEQNWRKPDPEKWRSMIWNIILKMRKDLLWSKWTKLWNRDFRYTDYK